MRVHRTTRLHHIDRFPRIARRPWFAGAALLLAACGRRDDANPAVGIAAAAPVTAAAFDPDTWRPPTDSEIPADSLGAAIRRGLALVLHTHDSLPRYAPGRITCSNCHLDAGRNTEAAPFAGAQARFPKYMERTGATITLADRVNYCFTRSLAGTRLPTDSREMTDILAYIAFLSRGVPVGAKTHGAGGLVSMRDTLAGDTARGAEVFRANCVACHGADGQGNPQIPPGIPALWGPKSFSVGASMARQERAASFIWHNMPFGRGKTLTPQQAFDVAAYVNSHARPDSPGKENDWPVGGAPRDVPYTTRSGHPAYHPPPLLPRANPRGAVVPPPQRAMRDLP
jgi:thiosulfate dehydrogenase